MDGSDPHPWDDRPVRLPAAAGEAPARPAVYWPRIARIAWQAFFLLLFLACLGLMTDEGVRRLPVDLLYHLDPLVAVGTLAAAWLLPVALGLALVTLAATVVFGRAFCGWACPLGTIHQLVAWATSRFRRGSPTRINGFQRHYRLKYHLLAAGLGAALLGSLAIGMLDPLSLLGRSIGTVVFPVIEFLGGGSGFRPRLFSGAFWTGAILVVLLVVDAFVPRWWCRAACPLGALLGWVSRVALFRIHVDPDRCTRCMACAVACQGADEPWDVHRVAECHVCLNCIAACPEGAIRYGFLAPEAAPAGGLDAGRRRMLAAGLAGAALVPLARVGVPGARALPARAMRPPGALPEDEFLARCIRCDACVTACPTGVLQPDLGRTGIEGLWTPVLDTSRAWCEPSCVLCGQVCPTGAIAPLTVAAKGWAEPGRGTPVRVGTAFIDHGRCLPWANARPCIVCEEVCPTSPKAIWLEEVVVRDREGREVTLRRPHVDPELCVGCGLCEARCPVTGAAAIRVDRTGESRSRAAAFVLPGPDGGSVR